MKKFTQIVAGICLAIALATSAFAADTAVKASTNAPVAVQTVSSPSLSGDWMLTLSGGGVKTLSDNSKTAAGINIGIGRTGELLLPVEAGIRQGIAYVSADNDTVILDTKGYIDWTLLSKNKFDVYAGGNLGVIYGDTSAVWTVAPEAGVRYWLANNVALVSRVEYPFNITENKTADALTYTVGFQVKF